MKKLYLVLQTPSVEMKVKSEPDCSGKTATLTAVFIRHDNKASEEFREKFREIQGREFVSDSELALYRRKLELDLSYLSGESFAEAVIQAETSFLKGKTLGSDAETTAARELQLADLRAFVKSQVVALKDVPLEIQETDEVSGKTTISKLVVPDTRTAADNMELWGEATNCLSALLDALLLSNPWSSALFRSLHKVFYNLNLGAEAEAKN